MAHDFEPTEARKEYESLSPNIKKCTDKLPRNEEQFEFLEKIEKLIDDFESNSNTFRGGVYMLDAIGGGGKSYLLKTISAYCLIKSLLCLCSAFSGVASQHFLVVLLYIVVLNFYLG